MSQIERSLRLIEQAHDHRFAELYRHGRQAHVDIPTIHLDLETAILR